MADLQNLDEYHPARMLVQENEAFRRLAARVRDDAQRAVDLPDTAMDPKLARTLANDTVALGHCTNHYRLKEELLVPALVDRGETDVARRVRSDDDRVRTCVWMAESLLQGAMERPSGSNLESVAAQLLDACAQVEKVALCEDEGLVPLALEILDEAAWQVIERESDRPEYSLSTRADLWTSPIDRAEAAVRRAITGGKLPGARRS